MTVQWSTTLRNALLDQIETTIGVSAVIKVFTGSQPANCATGDSGTLLAEFDLASDWASNAASGSKSLSSLPLSATAVGAGTAGYYRIYANGASTCHEQGSVGTSGTDAIIDNASIAVGQTVQITAWLKVAPGA